jgi:hypothetical protein
MNNDLPSIDRVRESYIDALLLAAYDKDQGIVAEGIERVMKQVERENGNSVGRSLHTSPVTNRPIWNRWISIAVAASLLIAMSFGLQSVSPSQPALAAIEKSIAAAAEQIARRYLVTVTFKSGEQGYEVQNDLYVKGNDRFALRHPAVVPGADLWLGKNGDATWVVPAIGPVLTGNETAFSRWLSAQEQLSTPYLHVTTVLNRMSRGYRLREMGESTIRSSDGNHVVCRHVVGERKGEANKSLPATIELWSDKASGVAIRVEASWSLAASESGREKVVIEFADQPDLPVNWFEPEGHYAGSRHTISFDTSTFDTSTFDTSLLDTSTFNTKDKP